MKNQGVIKNPFRGEFERGQKYLKLEKFRGGGKVIPANCDIKKCLFGHYEMLKEGKDSQSRKNQAEGPKKIFITSWEKVYKIKNLPRPDIFQRGSRDFRGGQNIIKTGVIKMIYGGYPLTPLPFCTPMISLLIVICKLVGCFYFQLKKTKFDGLIRLATI